MRTRGSRSWEYVGGGRRWWLAGTLTPARGPRGRLIVRVHGQGPGSSTVERIVLVWDVEEGCWVVTGSRRLSQSERAFIEGDAGLSLGDHLWSWTQEGAHDAA